MKNSIKTLAVIALLAIAGNAFGQTSASASATANATIICPMTLTQVADLYFGTLISGATAGTLTVNPNGTNDGGTGGVSLYHGTMIHNEPSAARFTVGGQGGYHYHVDGTVIDPWMTNGNTDPTPLGPGTVLFNSDAAADPILPAGDGCVQQTLNVGGTYSLPASATPGTYTKTFYVTVHYN